MKLSYSSVYRRIYVSFNLTVRKSWSAIRYLSIRQFNTEWNFAECWFRNFWSETFFKPLCVTDPKPEQWIRFVTNGNGVATETGGACPHWKRVRWTYLTHYTHSLNLFLELRTKEREIFALSFTRERECTRRRSCTKTTELGNRETMEDSMVETSR